MKSKLLKKIRNIGRSMVNIYSVTKERGIIIGMRVGFDDDAYKNIFSFGDTEEDIKQKACKIYLQKNIQLIRKKYRKYSKKYQINTTPHTGR